MQKKLWGTIPAWGLAIVLVLAVAGTALGYALTTRDVSVNIQEPITVEPATIAPVTLYPGQGVVFTVTNAAADVAYGILKYTIGH